MQSNQSTENCVSLLLMPSNSMHVLAFSLVMYVKYTVNILYNYNNYCDTAFIVPVMILGMQWKQQN